MCGESPQILGDATGHVRAPYIRDPSPNIKYIKIKASK